MAGNHKTDGAFYAHLRDLARGALKRSGARFSRFLDPGELDGARRAANEAGVGCAFFGGLAEAERVVCAFYADDEPGKADYPIACLKAAWDARYASAGHRDLLGAQMALGLERACLGDIAMGEGCAYLFVTDDCADYVAGNLTSAGRAKLTLTRVDAPGVLIKPEGRLVHVTVSSMRLDALVSGAYNLSRGEAQQLIARELVKLDHVLVSRSDARVEAGSLISARGYGRARVASEVRETKKGRLAVEVYVYGG